MLLSAHSPGDGRGGRGSADDFHEDPINQLRDCFHRKLFFSSSFPYRFEI